MVEVGDLETGFVGRAAELAAGQAEFARTSAGASVLAVTGEPGIGKSRYLSEIRRHAERAGWLVAAGQASEQERELSFSAFADALTPLVFGHPALVAGLPVGLADAIGAVLPAVGEPPSAPGTVLRHHAHLATQALLERLTADRALLLLLDDVHWADGGTVELIDHLLRHGLSGRLLLAVGFRPRQVSGRLAGVLSRAVAEVCVRYIRLGPLSVKQSAELLGCPPADPVANRLHEAADGNPLYLRTLARTGVAGLSSDMPLPADVDAALRTEVERLPAVARAVIEAASVLGTVFDPGPLPAVVDLPEARVWRAVDELVATDLLRADEGSGRLRFRHPLIRQVVYRAVGVGRRRTLHARAVRVLTLRSVPSDMLAHHVAHAAGIGDEAAIRVLIRAAAANQWRAPATAASWYAAALRLLPVDWRWPARRARLLVAKAECLMTAGLLPDSQQAISEAVPMLRHRALPVLRRAMRVAASVRQLRGRPDEAAAVLRRAVGQPGLADTELRLHLATVELLRGDLEAAWALADRVRDAVDDVSMGFGATAILAFVHASAGDATAAAAAAHTAGELLDASGDAELARQLTSAVWLMWADVMLTRYPRALRAQDRALELCRLGGRGHLLAQWLIGRAETLRRMGRLAEARASAGEANDLARLSGSDELTLFAVITSCRIAVSAGEVVEARRLAVEVRGGVADRSGLFSVLGLAVAAEASLLAGQADECTAGVLTAGDGDMLAAFDPSTRVMLYEVLVRAALAKERTADAQRWASLADKVCWAGVLPCAAGYAALADARVLLAMGRPGGAAAKGMLAVEEFARAGNPLDGIRARFVIAGAQAALGRRTEAIATLLEADEVAGRCGADRLRETATRELRRLGRRVVRNGKRGQGGVGWAALSQRERQVAELVANGDTNRAIAAELFLSEKTIERHLSSAFVKLGVSSRTALAREWLVSL